MLYDVVNAKVTHPSFKWANGLYAVIEKRNGELRMCAIDKDGKPEVFPDGSFMITCTGENNEEIHSTPLKLDYEPLKDGS
jgi:hypothetical protein